MARGGARPNSGPKKGTKYAPTLSKEAAREAMRQIVMAHMEELAAAQIANAKGIKFLVVRQKTTGKFLRVTESMAQLKSGALKKDEEIIEVWEKDPSVQAFTDLMNRALDKPKEQPQDVNVTGQIDVVTVLKQRQARRQETPKH